MQKVYAVMFLGELDVIILSNTREGVSSHFRTPRRELKIRRAAENFLANFEVFGHVMKHSFECFIYRLNKNQN